MTDLIRGTEAPRQRLDLMTRVDPRKAIRRARFHSLLVRHVRLGIVVLAGFAIISVAIIGIFDPFKRLPGNISVGHVGLKGSLVTMAAPKMAGMRPNGEPFELHSVSGVQDILKPDIVKLFGVHAKIVMDDSSTSRITADSGVYNSAKDMIWLKGNVHIINDSGYNMRMPSATVNIKSSALVTKEPVVVLLNGGRIDAASMDIEDNGHKISFAGDVKSVVDSRITAEEDGSGTAQMEAESSK
ncbi:MAG: LPS export ABC transporter periplasmic protein LptC [Methylovirgula sp.]